jgi:hypothetical protein
MSIDRDFFGALILVTAAMLPFMTTKSCEGCAQVRPRQTHICFRQDGKSRTWRRRGRLACVTIRAPRPPLPIDGMACEALVGCERQALLSV